MNIPVILDEILSCSVSSYMTSLRRVAKVCEDFGLRVQKSVFECWLEKDRFDRLWEALLAEIDRKQDSLVAYTLDATAAKAHCQAGTSPFSPKKRTRIIL